MEETVLFMFRNRSMSLDVPPWWGCSIFVDDMATSFLLSIAFSPCTNCSDLPTDSAGDRKRESLFLSALMGDMVNFKTSLVAAAEARVGVDSDLAIAMIDFLGSVAGWGYEGTLMQS